MKDYGMLLEKAIEHFFGNPQTLIYFANYYGDNFSTKALLFSICIKERNCNTATYTMEELAKLSEFEDNFLKPTVTHNDSVKCIEFLTSLIK